MKKSEIILHIYHHLLLDKNVSKEETMKEFDISSLKFARYISDIRSFLVNEKIGYQLAYERKIDRYCLIRIR